MLKSRKIRHCLLLFSIMMTVFLILSPFDWSLILKYSFKNNTQVQSLILNEDKLKLIEDNKPLLAVEEGLSFFVKLDDKYYFFETETETSNFCNGKECHSLQFYCRDDVCLSKAYEASIYVAILLFSLFFPFFIYGLVLVCEPKEAMS